MAVAAPVLAATPSLSPAAACSAPLPLLLPPLQENHHLWEGRRVDFSSEHHQEKPPVPWLSATGTKPKVPSRDQSLWVSLSGGS